MRLQIFDVEHGACSLLTAAFEFNPGSWGPRQ